MDLCATGDSIRRQLVLIVPVLSWGMLTVNSTSSASINGLRNAKKISGLPHAHTFKSVQGARLVRLCHFLSHNNPDIVTAMDGCLQRYSRLRATIKTALEDGVCYPWVSLTSLEPDKFLSDIVESIFGAGGSRGLHANCRKAWIDGLPAPLLDRRS